MTGLGVNDSLTLHDHQERLRRSERQRDGLQEKLEQLRDQRESTEKSLDQLAQQRVDLVGQVAVGTAKEAELMKIRKAIHAAREDLTDTEDVYRATERAYAQATKEAEAAKVGFKREVQKAWRAVHTALVDRHAAVVQDIANQLYTVGLECEPGLGELQFWSVLNCLNLKKPNRDEIQEMKRELADAFGLS